MSFGLRSRSRILPANRIQVARTGYSETGQRSEILTSNAFGRRSFPEHADFMSPSYVKDLSESDHRFTTYDFE